MSQGFYRFRLLFFSFFCLFFVFAFALSVFIVRYAKRTLYPEQPTVVLAQRNLNTMILTSFKNLPLISYIFQETHNLLVLMDPVIICIYLKTTGRHFRDKGDVRHPTSKLLKCDLVQTLITFRNPSLRIFAAGKASLVHFYVERET